MSEPQYLSEYNLAEATLAAPFVCSVSDGMDAAWVHLAGELDVATAPELRRKLREAEARARLVVLDLRGLAFMDASGIHAIVEASIRARQADRRLLLLRGPANVDRVFSLTGSADAVEIGDLEPLEPLEPVVRELQRSLVSKSLLRTGDRARGHRRSR
jgi:anti-sigma B factor antagonist